MPLVVDSSALVSALLNDGPARQALTGQVLHAPHLLDTELTSALRGLVAGKVIEPEQGLHALSAWTRLGVHRYAATGLLERTWELRSNLSAYDATYVALAETLGCSLLTGDSRISRAPGVRCLVTVVPV
ncbi:Predicted nucleic acid-binding protein, contains PIN domain [Quadrisphaera granulorum]|uniref:Ribonuclease VapC n=1 Tax=Quadrisphaera granulorum TaxID=317664 RepID=A0A315ZRK9_9ACTN|nr:type II toxin-antitoxin system VapC family toxin [Quadrisphaera granulorum]PWJ48171.1 putative nucleic acid-binding protein [Quadrisphaera granulorum]SZE98540.1 Predicted nucleic acid-binding protein, contains PIN domain [Quadrisphaera granulorum]